MDSATGLSFKDFVSILGGVAALLVAVKGLFEFAHANAIRRYEKFHQMSARFDENPDIQKVCALLHGVEAPVTVPTPGETIAPKPVTIQQKEVFICFMEEIAFMVNSKLMKMELALYAFGYYARLAIDNPAFWVGLEKGNIFYARFIEFSVLAKKFDPRQVQSNRLVY